MLFVPGQEGLDRAEPRTSSVVARILALDDEEVEQSLEDVSARFAYRHRDLLGTFRQHADELAERLDPRSELSEKRLLLLGATFTNEYAIEGAALCNPSMVPHPDQTGVPAGSLRFIMSVRAIGEGHRSSIEFRTGTVDDHGTVEIEHAPPFATSGLTETVPLDAGVFRSELRRLRSDGESADFVLDALGERFTMPELEERLVRLRVQLATAKRDGAIIPIMRGIAERTYGVRFPEDTSLAERVLLPAMSAERNGMEDARLVRFERPDGTVTYFATYTAFDGVEVAQQLLETEDFRSFTSAPVVGLPADKGLALFPAKSPVATRPFPDPTTRRTRSFSRTTCASGKSRFPTRCPPGPGRCSSSATAALRSRRRSGGLRSPTASARCAPTGSEPCSSISRTRPRSSASSKSPC